MDAECLHLGGQAVRGKKLGVKAEKVRQRITSHQFGIEGRVMNQSYKWMIMGLIIF